MLILLSVTLLYGSFYLLTDSYNMDLRIKYYRHNTF